MTLVNCLTKKSIVDQNSTVGQNDVLLYGLVMWNACFDNENDLWMGYITCVLRKVASLQKFEFEFDLVLAYDLDLELEWMAFKLQCLASIEENQTN